MTDRLPATPAELKAWDKAYVWHPFTQMKEFIESDPLTIVAAKGVKLKDSEGRWYYDGVSSLWLNVHGHRVPKIDRAITEQLGKVAHSTLLGLGNAPSILLAKRLVELAPPGLTRVFYSECGASAVEIALKLAVQFWANQGRAGKTRLLGFTGNYHGDTLGAVGVARDEIFHWPFLSLLPEHPRVPYPHCYRCPLGLERASCGLACATAATETIALQADRLAAVIFEPVEGAGGIIPAPEGYLTALRKACTEHDVLLIVDEVATGIGRTGKLFACEHEGVTPDLMCLGKGLSGGYLPLAATLATDRIFEAFLGDAKERKTFFHGHSFTGNPLSCNAALASLSLLEDLLPALPKKAARYREMLAPLADHPFVGDVRVAGFMAGIELVTDKESRTPFSFEDQAGYLVTGIARELSLINRPIGNVVILMPPLASAENELFEMVEILKEALNRAEAELRKLATRGEAT
jgi:adenosylmethionine---8-amino-7-oxononanoate aminotransferase